MTTYYFKIFVADKFLQSEGYCPRQGLYSSINLVTEALIDTIIVTERLHSGSRVERSELPPVPELKIGGNEVVGLIRYHETEGFIYDIEVLQLIHYLAGNGDLTVEKAVAPLLSSKYTKGMTSG
jgi:hypothetical protein